MDTLHNTKKTNLKTNYCIIVKLDYKRRTENEKEEEIDAIKKHK